LQKDYNASSGPNLRETRKETSKSRASMRSNLHGAGGSNDLGPTTQIGNAMAGLSLGKQVSYSKYNLKEQAAPHINYNNFQQTAGSNQAKHSNVTSTPGMTSTKMGPPKTQQRDRDRSDSHPHYAANMQQPSIGKYPSKSLNCSLLTDVPASNYVVKKNTVGSSLIVQNGGMYGSDGS
jgi:hypothetical protein